jgi:hypothetical protein
MVKDPFGYGKGIRLWFKVNALTGRELGIRRAAELRPVAHGLEQGLLHDVRWIELRAEACVDLEPGQERQPASIPLQLGGDVTA